MGMVVRTNTMALNAYRQLGMNNSAVTKSLEKLSSGYRINRAGDDAAGLAISEKMKAQIKGLETASANAQDGISLIQTAEGNLGEVHDMLNRMVELATKSANGTYTQTERDALQAEVDQLLTEIDRISQSANFNGAKLLDGSLSSTGRMEKTNIDILPDKAMEPTNEVGEKTVLHQEDVEMQKASFTLELHDLAFNPTAAVNGLDVKIGGDKVTLNLTFDADKPVTAGDIADAIIEKFKAATDDDGAGGMIEDVAFDVKKGDNGTSIIFTEKEDPTKVIKADMPVSISSGASAANKPTVTEPDSAAVNFYTDDINRYGDLNLAGFSVDKACTVTFTIFGKSYDIDISQDEIDNKDTKALDVVAAEKLAAKMDADKITDETIGDFNITYPGPSATGTVSTKINYEAAKAGDPKDTDTFKAGTSMTIAVKEGGTTGLTGTYNVETTVNTQGQLAVPDTLASTKFDLTDEIVKDGNVLTIGKQNYIFKTDADSKVTEGEGQVLIDVSGYADSKKLDMAGELISRAKNSAFTVGYDQEENTITIHEIAGQKDYTTELESVKAFDELVYYNGAVKSKADGKALTLQIGDTADSYNKMDVDIADMSANGLGLANLKVTTEEEASDAIDRIKTAINDVSSVRASMGALQNRLEHTINNLDVAAENLSAANSRIRDTDMAKEMMNYTKMNVLVQSAQAMLAQANQQPQSVLQLLQ